MMGPGYEPVVSGPTPVNIFLCSPSVDPDTDGLLGTQSCDAPKVRQRLFSNHAVTAAIMSAKKALAGVSMHN
jgi:hypothetical protein